MIDFEILEWPHKRPGSYVRQSAKRHATGTVVTIYDTNHPRNVFDPAGGRWVTVCEDHGSICNHETLALAKAHAPYAEWCEPCQAVRHRLQHLTADPYDEDGYTSIWRQ
jgi:hypothetical protein